MLTAVLVASSFLPFGLHTALDLQAAKAPPAVFWTLAFLACTRIASCADNRACTSACPASWFHRAVHPLCRQRAAHPRKRNASARSERDARRATSHFLPWAFLAAVLL